MWAFMTECGTVVTLSYHVNAHLAAMVSIQLQSISHRNGLSTTIWEHVKQSANIVVQSQTSEPKSTLGKPVTPPSSPTISSFPPQLSLPLDALNEAPF